MARRLLYLLVASGGALLLVLALSGWQLMETPGSVFNAVSDLPQSGNLVKGSVRVKIVPGEDTEAIAGKLEEAGVIDSSLQFRALVALQGVEKQLSAGEFDLEKGMAVTRVVDILISGFRDRNFVTIREGLRAEEIGALLEEKGLVSRSEFMLAVSDDYRSEFPFLTTLPPDATVEGYIFPDTYDFGRDATAQDIVRQLLANFGQRFSAQLRQEAAQTGLSIHEVVTLASIVEREAQVASERPIIAEVFLRRLELGMPLGADPTVQFAVAQADPDNAAANGYWKQELTVNDLALKSAYNTYINAGLPPGPIANPGLASLEAVLRPANVPYLYFVAKPDGSHAFSETLTEHQRNIALFQGQ